MYNHSKLVSLLFIRSMKTKDFCKLADISSGNLSDWKSGRSKPSLEAIERIANVLDCNIDYLVDRCEEYETYDKLLDNDILKMINALDEKGSTIVKAEIYKQYDRINNQI